MLSIKNIQTKCLKMESDKVESSVFHYYNTYDAYGHCQCGVAAHNSHTSKSIFAQKVGHSSKEISGKGTELNIEDQMSSDF